MKTAASRFQYVDQEVLNFVRSARLVKLVGERLLNCLVGEFPRSIGLAEWCSISQEARQDSVLSSVSMDELAAITDAEFLMIPNAGRKCLGLFRQFVQHCPDALED